MMKMNERKKKVGIKRFLTVVIPFLMIILTVLIAINATMNYHAYSMNYIFGEGQISVTVVDGDEALDGTYNAKALSSPQASSDAMLEHNVNTARESIVLLKNSKKALPLAEDERKLSVFGWYFEGAPYCVPASGSSSSSGDYVEPKEALQEAGFQMNEELLEQISEGVPEYAEKAPVIGRWNNDWAIPEYVPDDAQMQKARDFSDIALIWFSRQGTEGADCPQSMNENAFYYNAKTVGLSEEKRVKYGYDPDKHYLELTDTEKTLLNAVYEAKFEKVIVVINSDNPMELDFIRNEGGIDAALSVGGMGFNGFYALAEILKGEIAPSGRLSDTYAVDFKKDPTYPNHADLTGTEYTRAGVNFSENMSLQNSVYTNLTPAYIAQNGLRSNGEYMRYVFQNYEEGIYIGYRYYETRYGESPFYYDHVVYPFGYGLSYTTFDQCITNVKFSHNQIELDVSVLNTGTVAGKEVVQLYATCPYGKETTNPVKVEKSSVILCGIAKTKTLLPGEKEIVHIVVDKELLTSYDDQVNKCYVLDDGEYRFSLRKNAHEEITSYEPEAFVKGVQSCIWNNAHTVVYNEETPRYSERYAHDELGLQYRAATNAFERTLTGMSASFTNMSRADFASTFPQIPDIIDQTASEALIPFFKEYDISSMQDSEAEMPTTGAKNGIQLINMRGLDYDDPTWNAYLDQWTVEEMINITAKCGRGITENVEQGVPASVNSDGTLGIKYKSVDYTVYGTILPLNCTATANARTFNPTLWYEFGAVCGEEALQYGMNGWYAPALNLHRTPFGGRYYDYYSEDPFLSGTIGASVATGAGSKGLMTYLKHFSMNEGEYLRNYSSIWATEQVMRELYLKPFEIAIKTSKMTVSYYDGNGEMAQTTMSAVHGIMSAFNRVGNTWAGGNGELLQTVLREEWGFNGVVISDNMRTSWVDMDPDLMIRNGGDICLSGQNKPYADTQSASAVNALRTAVHNICFTVANSNAMNGIAPGSLITYGLAPWQIGLLIVDIVVGVSILISILYIIYRARDEKKNPEKYDKTAII